MYEGYSLFEVLKRTEIRHIKSVLRRNGGVKAAAAKELGIKRTTLIEKLRRYNLVEFASKAYLEREPVCRNGHSLKEAYVYLRSDRKGKPRRVCKVCAHNRYLKKRADMVTELPPIEDLPVLPKPIPAQIHR